jgi:stage II sporulation protein R
MKNKKFPTLIIFSILLATLFIAVIPTEAEGMIYEDTVRIHILANSDLDIDQNLKLEIRDLLLDKYSDSLKNLSSTKEAEDVLSALIPYIEFDAESYIKQAGFDYNVTATLVTEWYDTRYYEDFTLPQGYYSSLKVIIGEGEGKNWWCVMYPPMCLDVATDDRLNNGYTESELSLIRGEKMKVKFKILELISEITR